MLRQIYYSLKPFLPWRSRVQVRRWRAAIKRRLWWNQWPISPRSGIKPEGWPGWPQGKEFAVVLTHDVESAEGIKLVRSLAAIEEQRGFRSSFNFVPEDYSTPVELRDWLKTGGWEVGVHGLKHDGKLYQSQKAFQEAARHINRYLKEWGAEGFRSPFMMHNLDWIGDLDIQYDASTFDTDPFEPQPEGVDTIFPFWVPKAGGGGYAELPYTLVQDFTLFCILGETTIDVWKQKIDWIVERGGMVLVNVHPDYLDHSGNATAELGEFPAARYEELLDYIRCRYHGRYWHALPKEVSQLVHRARILRPSVTYRRVCMLSYSHYESDNRVIRYATALAGRGDEVEVLALARENQSLGTINHRGVWLTRLQRRTHNESSKWDYLFRLVRFFAVSAWTLAGRHLHRKYDLIHVHNIPDFLVFAAILPRLLGARVVLDIHDMVPELFASKFKGGEQSVAFRLLKFVEYCSARFCHHVIISNHLWFDKITSRSVPKGRCSTYINYVDLETFSPRERTRLGGPFTILFPGGYQWHQGLDVAIRAFKLFQEQVPMAEFHLYGNGDQEKHLKALTIELGIEEKVRFFEPLPIDKVATIIANADLGVVPKRANSFGDQAYSTKILEFMSQGVPVVISRTQIDSYYFNENVVRFFESENIAELARAMYELSNDDNLRRKYSEAGRTFATENSWGSKKHKYVNLVDNIIESASAKENGR